VVSDQRIIRQLCRSFLQQGGRGLVATQMPDPAEGVLELRNMGFGETLRDRMRSLKACLVSAMLRQQARQIVGNDKRARLLLQQDLVLLDGRVDVALEFQDVGLGETKRRAAGQLTQAGPYPL
jgi:hypothetical protein